MSENIFAEAHCPKYYLLKIFALNVRPFVEINSLSNNVIAQHGDKNLSKDVNKSILDPAWFPASTRPRSFESTGRHGSDLLSPGQKPAKLFKLLNSYLGNRLSVACVQSFFSVN